MLVPCSKCKVMCLSLGVPGVNNKQKCNTHYHLSIWGQYNFFNQQGCIKLIKSDSKETKDIYYNTKDLY